MRVIVAITGASGVVYGQRLVEELLKADAELHLVVSDAARRVAAHETPGYDFCSLDTRSYDPSDLAAPIASGSFRVDAMVVAPCSMKTLGALASGYCPDLISRAADVQLKERRKLVLVPRETPLHEIHLENMAKLSRMGAVIMPAAPGFYGGPNTVDDLVNFIVGKILDQLGVENSLAPRWSG